jgi:predicted transcriptional regulator
MRYEYTITKEGAEAEIMKAMSYKKFLKSLLLKYSKFTGWITYINKKKRSITRSFRNGRENTYGDNQYDYKK